MKVLKKAVDISFQKMLAYPHEIYMVFIHSLLSVIMTLFFWKVLFFNMNFEGNEGFIYLLAFNSLIADGLSEIFFGFRDFEYLVRDGSLDNYLVKPRNAMFLILIERIPLIAFLEKIALGIFGLITVFSNYNIHTSPNFVILSFLFMIIGVIYYQAVYGIITLLSLKFERSSDFRDILFSVEESKKYPVTIFPKGIRYFLTYIIPVSLVAYYPTLILTGRNEKLSVIIFSLPIAIFIFYKVYKSGIKTYSSNGG